MEQTATPIIGNPIEHSLDKPLFISNVNILSPGIWTGEDNRPTRYTSESIEVGLNNSEDILNLYLDHKDTKGSAVSHWVGIVKNMRMLNGSLVGNLEVWHPLISMFISKAKAKFAVSATMDGREINGIDGVIDYEIFYFKSVSIVDDPGCVQSWLPKMLSAGRSKNSKTITAGSIDKNITSGSTSIANGHSHTWSSNSEFTSTENNHNHKIDLNSMIALEKNDHVHKLLSFTNKENTHHKEKKLAAVTDMEEVRKEKEMSVEDFYAVPRDSPNSSSLPIFDAAHVRNSLAKFEQTSFNNTSQKKSAMDKIVRAAKKFEIDISKESSKKKLESCKEVKKMTEENTNEGIEEQKEEVAVAPVEEAKVKEVAVEETAEEAPVEEAPVEEVKSKESSEDVKELSAKVDTLAKSLNKLTSLVQKSLSAGENSENETKEEAKVDEESAEDEESDVEKELEETKKELAAVKARLDSPDAKTLSRGSEETNLSVDDANAGMLEYLKSHGSVL